MTKTELIDHLCTALEMQAKIIHEQAVFIEEELNVDSAMKEHFASKRADVDREIDNIAEHLPKLY